MAELKTLEDAIEGVGVLAGEMVALKEAVGALGELLRLMDARIEMLTKLIDIHHEILIRAGWAPPRPEGQTIAN